MTPSYKWIAGGLAVALGAVVAALLMQQGRKARTQSTDKPIELNRWEGEGGNVPPANPALLQPATASGATD
ncbi:MAG: hypothetical protein KIT73_00985 [Burkholderiales bacterium]|nr:hypothetical protein [Burkholderiales bacterium]